MRPPICGRSILGVRDVRLERTMPITRLFHLGAVEGGGGDCGVRMGEKVSAFTAAAVLSLRRAFPTAVSERE